MENTTGNEIYEMNFSSEPEQPIIRASFTVCEDDYRSAFRALRRNNLIADWIMLGIMLFVLLFILVPFQIMVGGFIKLIIWYLFLCVIVFLLTVLTATAWKRAWKTQQKSRDQTVNYDFYGDRFIQFNLLNSTTVFYSDAVSWAESNDMYFIFISKRMSVFLPKRSFEPDEDFVFFNMMCDKMQGKKFKKF